ncbi:glycosyltransferase [Lachnospiraceae bacterium C1.1]|nr:glycosyltransferase family 2 protein [Lachnospiraceae bacterium C1.1]
MVTISLCMIVKNEEQILERCLDSVADLMDEIIIVDTGSEDKTKEIARRYTDKVYDFKWDNDFAAARNFAFSHATKEYIYSADADEVIDSENHEKFAVLKEHLLSEIEVVQMYYTNQLEYNTTYNYDEELRPKLYRRVRTFTWQDAVHENVRLNPVVFDSDIKIIHKPTGAHQQRDFFMYQNTIKTQGDLSEHMQRMYARELFIAGSDEDFIEAMDFFKKRLDEDLNDELIAIDCSVLAKCARLKDDKELMLKAVARGIAIDGSPSELLYELGEYYRQKRDYAEAELWYYNAAFETESILSAAYHDSYPLIGLHICYVISGDRENAAKYAAILREKS